jgi:hypothetical protein
MQKLLKVKDQKNLYREADSKGLNNVDNRELLEYKEKRKLRLKSKNALDACQSDINILKNEINDIKNVMYKILNKLD